MTIPCPSEEQLLALAADDPGSDEVRRHAESCQDCNGRLARVSAQLSALRALATFPSSTARSLPPLYGQSTVSTASANAPTAPMPAAGGGGEAPARPASIGRYVVIGSAGTGGQAEVFRVVDPELGRTLVLKLSRGTVRADDAGRDAILAEGRLLAEIDHPNIVRVFDVGFHHGRPYLVMEHVYGQNLEQLCESARPAWREATRLMSRIARVVAFAHRRGVVHGDLTPRNILVDQDGDPRLIDFGMFRIRDAWEERALTSGGTAGFLAP